MIDSPETPLFLASETALSDFISQFEQGTWPKPMWTHAAHVAMATWYLLSLPRTEATSRVRDGIRRYNEAVGGSNTADSGYHETLTLFWLCVIAQRLSQPDVPGRSLEAVRLMVVRWAQPVVPRFLQLRCCELARSQGGLGPSRRRKNPWEQE